MITRLVKLADIKTTFFVRERLDQERVLALADLYQSNEITIALIQVDEELSIIDGRHRLEAMMLADITEYRVEIIKTVNSVDSILRAVRANVGGSLPPTQGDFQHVIELLIEQGMKRAEIINHFPLPRTVTEKYYRLTTSRLYKVRIGTAVDRIADGRISIKEAAERFNVKEEDLREIVANRKKRKHPLANKLADFDKRVRGVSAVFTSSARKLIGEYHEGLVSKNEIDLFVKRISNASKSISRNVVQIQQRVEQALNKTNLSGEE